jgi:2-succinyl-6-hydroxy-2,4-cyclohexadiene-1-carboxylate synthase
VLRAALSASATVISLDAIGHGQSASPLDPARYTLEQATGDLLDVLQQLCLTRVDVLGYSMGGRMALHFARHHPERVRTLILESASPGIADDGERARRMASDEALAQRIEHGGIDAFVAEWERTPLLQLAAHVSEDVRAEQHAERLRNNPRGLANSLRGMGAGRQTPLWPQLAGLNRPVTLITGAQDRRYRAIAQDMLALLPDAVWTEIAHAGHTVHLDEPAEFASVVGGALGASPGRHPSKNKTAH